MKEKFSPSSQKSGSDAAAVNLRASDLRGDSGTFKSLSSGIWGPVSSQPPHATSLSVVCDDSTPDKQAWNNSDSTSSSRSSSRQELSSIMDSDLPPSNNVWNSSALLEDMTPTPQEAQGGINTALSDQGVPTGSQWVPGRGAYSAPSSPSLPRAHNLPESAPPSMGGRPSVDDFAVRSWNSKRRSPRSLSSSEPSTAWNENLPAQPRRSSVDLSQPGGGENSIPAHPWQQYSRLPQGYPPGLTMRENWREQQGPVGNSEINQLLQRLSLEKYVPLFEVWLIYFSFPCYILFSFFYYFNDTNFSVFLLLLSTGTWHRCNTVISDGRGGFGKSRNTKGLQQQSYMNVICETQFCESFA